MPNYDVRKMPLIDGSFDIAKHTKAFKRKCGRIQRDFVADGFCSSPYSSGFDVEPFDDAADRFRQAEKDETDNITFLRENGIGPKDQDGINYCWINAPIWAFEFTRAKMGLPRVKLSSASVGCKIKNFKNVGGWGTQGLDYLVEHGAVPDAMWPNNALDRKYDTAEADAERPRYKGTEFYELKPKDLRQLDTALLMGLVVPVGLSWWGHEVTIVWKDSQGNYIHMNSWGEKYGDKGLGRLTPDKAKADDALCFRQVIAS